MKRALIAAATALSLAACASTPVYGPLSGGYGYAEQKIEQNRFRVTYRAKGMAAADDGALRRAAELTLREGRDWFQIVGRDTELDRSRNQGPSIGIGGATGGRNSSVGLGVQLPLGGGAPEDATVQLEILMGEGTKPAGPEAYDARQILGNIQP